MRLGQDEYEDKAIDITPHVKARVWRERLRVYFETDRARGRIIVGHVGGHLETYETKFMH